MVQAVRGMRDVLPQEARRWRLIEDQVQEVLHSFAYEEIHLPLLEFTELFARGVGEATDIVEKEMYSLADRDGDSLSLRPEGTASCVRALQEHGLLYNQTQRVFYSGPMFRYEKPQKGRYRQFYQIGAEAFGFDGPDVDAELIVLGAQCWDALGIADRVQLHINTLGSGGAREAYRSALLDYLTPLAPQLDEDSQRRLNTNPLRILDSKDPGTQLLLADAPRLPEFVDAESQQHFEQLQETLTQLGIGFTCNPNLVRGLDYYTHTVFEWLTEDLGAQGAVCAGGRYNGLVERLGGKPTAAAGFALGLDRVALLHEVAHPESPAHAVDVYVCYGAAELSAAAQELGIRLRQALHDQGGRTWKLRVHMGGGNFKKQLKKANASGARWAILLGQEERAANQVTLKDLRDGTQITLGEGGAVSKLIEG